MEEKGNPTSVKIGKYELIDLTIENAKKLLYFETKDGEDIYNDDMDFFVNDVQYMLRGFKPNGCDGCGYEGYHKAAATDWYLNMFLFDTVTESITQVHLYTSPMCIFWHLEGPEREGDRDDDLFDWIEKYVRSHEKLFLFETGNLHHFKKAFLKGNIIWDNTTGTFKEVKEEKPKTGYIVSTREVIVAENGKFKTKPNSEGVFMFSNMDTPNFLKKKLALERDIRKAVSKHFHKFSKDSP